MASSSSSSPTNAPPVVTAGRIMLKPSALKVAPSEPIVPRTENTSPQPADASSASESLPSRTFQFAPLTGTASLSGNGEPTIPLSTSNGIEKAANGNGDTSPASGSSAQSAAPAAEEEFVFGQNLSKRAILPVEPVSTAESETPNAESSSGADAPNSSDQNGAANEDRDKDDPSDDDGATPTSENRKRTYEAITGEEDESNALNIHCKLYHWEAGENVWREKGKGPLKLNDKVKDDKLSSRLVMRTAGSLKVILNSSLVAGMNFTLTQDKTLRFTNIDGIYLLKGKEKDIEQLNLAIDYRVRELSKRMKSSDPKEETEAEPKQETNTRSSSLEDASN